MNTNNTHEKYVSLETAKLLKEAGFDWTIDCDFVYAIFNDRTEFLNNIYVINVYESNLRPGLGPLDRDSYVCKYHAPTLDVAQRWLREVKGIYVESVLCVNRGTSVHSYGFSIAEINVNSSHTVKFHKFFKDISKIE